MFCSSQLAVAHLKQFDATSNSSMRQLLSTLGKDSMNIFLSGVNNKKIIFWEEKIQILAAPKISGTTLTFYQFKMSGNTISRVAKDENKFTKGKYKY